ncbi:MAG TPA: hypothetical protein VFD73_21305 [Gemmatimonadales bacterium]|nr:hypothetical protein [Gemmatimonadales bacterium]
MFISLTLPSLSLPSARILALFALLLVADAITVYGRGPRPVSFSGQDVRQAVLVTRSQAPALA